MRLSLAVMTGDNRKGLLYPDSWSTLYLGGPIRRVKRRNLHVFSFRSISEFHIFIQVDRLILIETWERVVFDESRTCA